MRYRSALLLTFLSAVGSAQIVQGPLAISLRDAGNASTGVLSALQREVEAIMAPSAIRITWLFPETAQNQDVAWLAVIRLVGQCRPDALIPAAVRFAKDNVEALGQTHVVDGKVLPIADVRCDAVRRFIQSELQGIAGSEREQLLGRALGRVLAHELYHVLLRTRNHGHDGLSRPAQSSAELVASRTQFAQQDERKLAESRPSGVETAGIETDR
jgi:hypothetical protein